MLRWNSRGWWVAAYLAVALSCTAAWLLLDQRLAEQTGLRRQVWLTSDFEGAPLINDVSPGATLDFLDEDPRLPRRFFSARWRGYWYVPTSRSVTLQVVADDYADIWIAGELRFNRSTATEQIIPLDAGVHELRIDYQQYGGRYAMRLFHSFPDSFFGNREQALPYRHLFHEPPTADDIRLTQRVASLERLVLFVWLAPVLLCAAFLTHHVWTFRAEIGPYSPAYGRHWKRAFHVAFWIAVAIVTLSATLARVPGWNPASLRHDDLVYGAIIRADLWSMLTVPIHVAPGLFVLWRVFYELFPDPEWSLQVFPLVCAIASIPIMALVVRNLTNDYNLGLLAASMTALNPLLARYSVTVHQYSFDFLVTAFFLLAATRVCRDWTHINSRVFARVALAGGAATFFSVPSALVSFPIIHLAALVAAEGWRTRRRQAGTALLATIGYDLAVLSAYLLLRARANDSVRGYWGDGFLPLDSFVAAWSALADNGQRVLAASFPDWGLAPWLLPFIALGAIGLVARRETRFVGLSATGIGAAFVAASALSVYPMGTGRPDIFFLPVAIVLFVGGLHVVMAWLPRPSVYRFTVGTVVSWFAVVSPVHVEYPDSNLDAVRLADTIVRQEEPGDGLVLTWPAGFAVGFYGPWDVDVAPFDQAPNATQARVIRDLTLHLPRANDGSQARLLRSYLTESPPERIWLGSSREPEAWLSEVLAAFEDHGFDHEEVLETTRYKLWLMRRW